MRNENSSNLIIDILNNQKYAVIATKGKKYVHTNLVAFISSDDLKNIYFATSKKSKKFENLMNNPNVSFLIDNRKNTSTDILNATAITIFGVASEINKKTEIMKLYLKKHPGLNNFVNNSDSVFIDVKVDNYIYVNKFENRNILNP
jgi:nitroimidazol reductase NimA-like FMN-containing flavoprotein (pyridoxamine 5'-phosphate oxidase superfamily)